MTSLAIILTSVVCLFSMILITVNIKKYNKHEKKMNKYLHDVEKIHSLQTIHTTPNDSKKEMRRKRRANRKVKRAKKQLNK